MEIQEKQENLALGILGALLGGILGGAAIVLFAQLERVSAVSGVVLAFCTLKGYELLGKKLSKTGILISIAVMLIMPYLADRINWAIALVQHSMDIFGFQLQFGDAFKYVHDFVEEYGMQSDYRKDLSLIYAFTALGAIGVVIQAFKQKKED